MTVITIAFQYPSGIYLPFSYFPELLYRSRYSFTKVHDTDTLLLPKYFDYLLMTKMF